METLPSEILDQILSHLDHNDSIECVRVCQSWRKLIPPHVASLWSHIHLQQYAYHILDAVPIFAPFINTITLINFDVHLENALKTLNRTSKHLVLQKLKLQGTRMQANTGFIELFKPLRIDDLWIDDTTRDISEKIDFLDLMAAAQPRSFYYSDNPNHLPDICPSFTFNLKDINTPFCERLVSLTLRVYGFQYDLMTILQHCPNLKRLQTGYDTHADCQDIMTACPRLEYLDCNSIFDARYQFDWIDTPADDEHSRQERSLRFLRYRKATTQTLDFVLQHQSTLELLHLDCKLNAYRPQWQPFALQFQSNTLRMLSCRMLGDGEFLSTLLPSCPNLERVQLNGVRPRADLYHALASLPKLELLELGLSSDRTQPEDEPQALAELQQFLSQLSSSLKYLILKKESIFYNMLKPSVLLAAVRDLKKS
ncbi:hypothetical protein LRAMOSA02822 [Lichtheimia ramosa]|uniref:F-box domain-containing protein n=1 Tax=Lichtheimia ramosa TaxID=688394 RepID=A0A077WS26_9FUNG|nr:hypothetical protein LRAMOSA02822 [Lichtheimia ramosa]